MLSYCVAPSGAPQNVCLIMISNTVILSWSPIDCIERNGVITNYITEFQLIEGGVIPGTVTDRNFTSSRLSSSTNYTFRVAGVNSEGIGLFSNITLITTAGKLYLSPDSLILMIT